LTIGLALFAAGLVLLPVALLLVRRIYPGRNPYFLRYGFAKAVVAFLLYAGVPALGGALLPEFALRAPLLSLAGGLAAFGYAAAVCRRMQPEGWRALGFHAGGHPRAFGAAGAALLFALPAILGAGELTRGLLELYGHALQPQPLLLGLLELLEQGGPRALAALLLAVLALPLLEEIFFRGFLQPLCTQNFGDRGGLVVTSLLFTVLHQPADVWPGLFVLSMVCGGVMLRTQRVLAAWAVHALWNGGVLAVLLYCPEARQWLL